MVGIKFMIYSRGGLYSRAKVRKIGKEMRQKGVYLCFLVIYCIFLWKYFVVQSTLHKFVMQKVQIAKLKYSNYKQLND